MTGSPVLAFPFFTSYPDQPPWSRGSQQRWSCTISLGTGLSCLANQRVAGRPISPAARICGTLAIMTAILTTLLGGFLAIAGGLVGIALGDRRERSRWLRDSQWQASTNLLSALQLLIRRMINVSYLDEKESHDPASAVVASFSEATVAWNSALYSALLITPPEVAAEIPQLDREVDRLLDLAVSRRWKRGEFRKERIKLGRMAAEYLRRARKFAELPDIELPSIWAWDDGSQEPSLDHQSPAEDTLGPTA
jgi:hypothetical protein